MGPVLSFLPQGGDDYGDGTQVPDPGTNYVLAFAAPSRFSERGSTSMKTPSPSSSRNLDSSSKHLLSARSPSSDVVASSSKNLMSKPSPSTRSPSSGLVGSSRALTPSSSTTPEPAQGGKVATWVLRECRGAPGLQDFELGRVIGKGLMGTVRLARWRAARTAAYVAIKSVDKAYVMRHHDERHIEYEREILMAVSASAFCIKLFSAFQTASSVHFALELVPGGELFQRMRKVGRMLPNEARFYVFETFAALYHIHTLGYCYRDLKPENVMIDVDGHCKLVDFGFSTRPNEEGLMRTAVGTPVYLSPEQLNSKHTNGYTSACDFWSLGIFLFELLTGRTPYSKNLQDTQHEVYLRILRSRGVPFPSGFDRRSKAFINALCRKDFSKRLWHAEDIRRHKYFYFKEHKSAPNKPPPSSSSSSSSAEATPRVSAAKRRGSEKSTSAARVAVADGSNNQSSGDNHDGGKKRRSSFDSPGTAPSDDRKHSHSHSRNTGEEESATGSDAHHDDDTPSAAHDWAEEMDTIWAKVNSKRLIPPYVPKFSSVSDVDKYFRAEYENEPLDKKGALDASTPFVGF